MKENTVGDCTDSLIRVMQSFNYRGVLVEKLIGGYCCLGIKCLTMEDVDNVINDSLKNLGNSLSK